MPPAQSSHLLMLVATALVATSFPVGAQITTSLDSLVLTFLRFAVATVLFAPIVVWHYGLSLPTRRDFARYALLSACLVGYFWSLFVALRYTSPLNTATIFSLTPAITVAVSALLLKGRAGKGATFALILGVVGAVWVVFRGDLRALLALQVGFGDLLFFSGTIALGFYGALVKFLHRGEPMLQMTFWTLATGALWLFVLSAPRLVEVDWSAVPLAVYGGVTYLAVFTTLITFFLFQRSTPIIGPVKVMSYTYLSPAFVLLIGVFMGQGLPPPAMYPGLVLTIVAVVILQVSRPVAVAPKALPREGIA